MVAMVFYATNLVWALSLMVLFFNAGCTLDMSGKINCQEDSDCLDGKECIDNICTIPCQKDDDCPTDEICNAQGRCEEEVTTCHTDQIKCEWSIRYICNQAGDSFDYLESCPYGCQDEINCAKGVQVHWQFSIEDESDEFTTSPAIVDNALWIISNKGRILKIRLADMQILADYTIDQKVESTPALGADQTIYFGAVDGNLHAYNPYTGTEKWYFDTERQLDTSPALGLDGTIYVASYEGVFYALDPEFGGQSWQFDIGNIFTYCESSPAVGEDGTIYLGANDGYLYALSPTTHLLRWDSPSGIGEIRSSVAISSAGTIYAGASDGRLYAFEPRLGIELWQLDTGYDIASSPIVGEDQTIYVVNEGNELWAVDPQNGTERWHKEVLYNPSAYPNSCVAAQDGTIFAAAGRGLKAFRQDGSIKWEKEMPERITSYLSLTEDGILLVPMAGGLLYAYNVNTPLASSSWPKHRADLSNSGRVNVINN
jgi:outer membrane protein assembly factor BamB